MILHLQLLLLLEFVKTLKSVGAHTSFISYHEFNLITRTKRLIWSGFSVGFHHHALATDSFNSVKFSFLTTEEVRKYSFKKITPVQLFDNLGGPVPGGLYDPAALGPLRYRAKSCGQRALDCPGHCGHNELASLVYNPLLFTILQNLLKKTCFSCHHFTDKREEVEKCVSKLQLIMMGDIVAANSIDVSNGDLASSDENAAGHVKDVTDCSRASSDNSKHLNEQNWTSLQYGHAVSILKEFMKKRSKKCDGCGVKCPTITNPTFGWMYMPVIAEAEHKVITSGVRTSDGVSARGMEVDSGDTQSSGAVYDCPPVSSAKAKKDRVGNVSSEFSKQMKLFSGPLLPSEAEQHIKLLWDNET